MPDYEYSALYNDPVYGRWVNPNYRDPKYIPTDNYSGYGFSDNPWDNEFKVNSQRRYDYPSTMLSKSKNYNKHTNKLIKTQPTEQDKANRQYNTNVLLNTVGSTLKNTGLWDSGIKLYEKKRDTPDHSGLENYQRYASQETPVQRANPYLIGGNNYLTYTPRDVTESSNKTHALFANMRNLLARQSRGNFNALAAQLNNSAINESKTAAENELNTIKTNEELRMAIAAHNLGIDRENATALNNAENNYINARNVQTAADKRNSLDVLQYVDQQKYARDMAHQHQVDDARDEFVSNLGTYGMNAMNANEANTDQSYNYWKDAFGRLHYNGGKPYDYNLALDNDIWQSVYDNASDDEKVKLNGMTRQQRRNYIVDKLYKANA